MLFMSYLTHFVQKRSDQDLNKWKKHNKEQKQQSVALATICRPSGKWQTKPMFFWLNVALATTVLPGEERRFEASGWWRGRNPLAKKGVVAIATYGLPGEMCNLYSKYKSPFPSFQTGYYYIFRERIGRKYTVFIEQECLSLNSLRFFEKSSSWHGLSTFLPLL